MAKALTKLLAIVQSVGDRSEWDRRALTHHRTVNIELENANEGDLEQFAFAIDESEVATFRERVGKKVVLTIEDA